MDYPRFVKESKDDKTEAGTRICGVV